ncbi:MAG: AAA family ATPase [Muribaculaceae bacterium]|nr:AAA family ATPase [Muribaculaceae bacterium]
MMVPYTLPENIDLNNAEFQTLWQLITKTQQSVFLTGKAGTGKSTFLKYICNNTSKKFIVLAPTGIAAVNVGGMTMHSFFKMPLKPLLPDDPEFTARRIRKTLKYNKDKVKILKELDLIIIDEISMVRPDMIDFMDKVLRVYCENMREPFGGKQILFVGDIFQLEPVITPDMRDILRRYYKQFFFFNAQAFEQLNLVPIELKKIYRQDNEDFIKLLDNIRIDKLMPYQLEAINKRYSPNYVHEKDEFIITLASRRDIVDYINQKKLDEIDAPEFKFIGEITDEFPLQNLPTAKDLILKVGAQILFVRNDKDQRWVNGTLGRICSLDEDVVVELEDGSVYSVEPAEWENIQYSYDEKKKAITEKLLGTFKQYPLKPAWALTVHKSQGLTFNRVIIDFGGGGAFAGGQTYVALSRCRSLDGITLANKITPRDIIVNPAVVDFSRRFNNSVIIKDALVHAEAKLKLNSAAKAFDNANYADAVNDFFEANSIFNVMSQESTKRLIRRKLNVLKSQQILIDNLKSTINHQNEKLKRLAKEYVDMGKLSVAPSSDVVSEESIDYNNSESSIDSVAVKSAIANYNKAIEICPDFIDAYFEKGKLYCKLGEYEQGIIYIKKANEIDSTNPDVLFELGKAHLCMKDYPQALKMLKKANKYSTSKYEIYVALADCYSKIGLEEMADKYNEMAASLINKKKNKR